MGGEGTRSAVGADFSLAGSLALRSRFHCAIPGGAHTYAKGDDQWPEHDAPYVVRGHGCRVWDVDGNEYIEYGMGLRSVTLGHAYPAVVDAVADALQLGTNFVRPTVTELECAELFLDTVGADMVKFAKNGSDVTTAAVKLARAYTGRDIVAVCTSQPFFSIDDWFIVTTPVNAGIPAGVGDLTVGFRYNALDDVRALFERYPGRIAVLVLEVERTDPPAPGFLQGLVDLAHEEGALVLFDEMVTGFRWHRAGAQAVYGVRPDLSTWGKAMANGFALAALAGRREIMELGGLHHDRDRVFLLSTTNAAETVGLAAGIATIGVYRREDVTGYLHRQGDRLRAGLDEVIRRRCLEGRFSVFGRSCSLFYGTNDADGKPSQPFRTLFLQETVRRGLLAPSFITSYSHDDATIDRTVEIVDAALGVYAQALEGGVDRFLEGASVKPVYRRRN
jgi:glutamate-1-semialdehyde 2,1-aminomutase